MNLLENLFELNCFDVIETVDKCKEIIGRDYGRAEVERIESDAVRIYEKARNVFDDGRYDLMRGGLLLMQASLYLFTSASDIFDRQLFLSEVEQMERGEL